MFCPVCFIHYVHACRFSSLFNAQIHILHVPIHIFHANICLKYASKEVVNMMTNVFHPVHSSMTINSVLFSNY